MKLTGRWDIASWELPIASIAGTKLVIYVTTWGGAPDGGNLTVRFGP